MSQTQPCLATGLVSSYGGSELPLAGPDAHGAPPTSPVVPGDGSGGRTQRLRETALASATTSSAAANAAVSGQPPRE